VSEAPPEVTSLGELALQHAARCPGVAGVVELRVALSEPAAPYQRFLALEVSDDLGTVWTEGVLPSELFANPIAMRGWSDCSDPGTILVLGPPVAPGLRTFLATASVVDGAVLQTISGELDVACPFCPITGIPTPVDAGTPSDTGPPMLEGSSRPQRGGCSVTSHAGSTAGSRWLAVVLALAIGMASRRRS
jgi:hypothetical protein